jgi:hypothetical protein
VSTAARGAPAPKPIAEAADEYVEYVAYLAREHPAQYEMLAFRARCTALGKGTTVHKSDEHRKRDEAIIAAVRRRELNNAEAEGKPERYEYGTTVDSRSRGARTRRGAPPRSAAPWAVTSRTRTRVRESRRDQRRTRRTAAASSSSGSDDSPPAEPPPLPYRIVGTAGDDSAVTATFLSILTRRHPGTRWEMS